MLSRSRLAFPVALLLTATSAAAGTTFRLELGPAFAANAPGGMKKGTAFAVRARACEAPAQPALAAVAHAIVNGKRQSVALDLVALGESGAYAVPYPSWPRGTVGVVALTGSCDALRAGAVVRLAQGGGFAREDAKVLDRAPSNADIDQVLAARGQTSTR